MSARTAAHEAARAAARTMARTMARTACWGLFALVATAVPSTAVAADQDAHAGPARAAPAGEPLPSIGAARALLQDAPPELWLDLESGRYREALVRLTALESRWAMHAPYNALFAEVALAARAYPLATLALERLVLLEPRNAGAWLDLAVASEAMGDADTARRAIAVLERDFEIPTGIRLVLVSLRAKLAAAGAAPRTLRLRAGLMFGYDTNANGGLSARSLVLTPAEGPIELPIDPAYRPRPSVQVQASFDALGRWELPLGPVEGKVSLSEKRRTRESEFDSRDVALALAGSFGRDSSSFWLLELRQVDLGQDSQVRIPRLRVGRDLDARLGRCRPSVGLEAERRRYGDELAAYDADIFWADVGARCSLWGGQLSALARLGSDRGSDDRPGGDANRVELAALWQGEVAANLDLVSGLTLSRVSDSEGYSPLIRNGLARSTRRATLKAELAWNFAPGWQGIALAEYTNQSSNLGLFALTQTVVMFGVRYQR